MPDERGGLNRSQGKEIVFAQDDRATNVMYIQEGGVKLIPPVRNVQYQLHSGTDWLESSSD
jgi:hypothetical protein